MKKYIIPCFLSLMFVFSGCAKAPETVHIDKYSYIELLNHRKNASADKIKSPKENTHGDLKADSSVFITKTGKKYHTSTCSFLKDSMTETTLQEAISKNLTPCSNCHPDKQ